MMRSVRFVIVLSVLLLVLPSAQANTITASLDNPPNGEGITGNGTINGWAFATNGADVEVHPRIGGTTQEDVIIPCCGPRQDVANAVDGAPLNTGYAGSINYALLGAGQHTVGVEIRAEGCDPVILENTVEVTVPGNVEFVPEFSWWDAWSAIDFPNDELVVVNAATGAAPNSHDFESVNLRIDYSLSGQNAGIMESWSEDEETHDRWDAVQTIFTNNCTSSGCHSGSNPAADQDLTQGNAPPNTIAVRSLEVPNSFRVNPGRPDESYLLEKIESDSPAVGQRMPIGGVLSDAEIETIRNWILDGAVIPHDFAGHGHGGG